MKQFLTRIEMFQKGFEAITKSISDQLAKMAKDSEKLADNTAHMSKIVSTNKDIMKSFEKLTLTIDALMSRLDKLSSANS